MESSTPTYSVTAKAYRMVWRWHFYAGLIVMPVLMLMALTGGLYLFQDQIEGAINRPLLTVEARSQSLLPEAWAHAASAATPGRVTAVATPADPTRSAQVMIKTPSGASRTVYIDPHTGRVLGHIDNGGIMQVVKRLHSLDIAGPIANLMVEVVAGWAIVMVATGIVLWWPKGVKGGVVTVRGKPNQRLFWRDSHAVIGIFAGVIIVFLAATGMPWSAFWGKEVRSITTQAGWGRPPAPNAIDVHADHNPGRRLVPWALEETAMGEMPGMDHHARLTLNDAVMAADAAHLPRPYIVGLPKGKIDAWTASYLPVRAEGMRTLYLSPSTGEVLGDVGFSRFGPAAKAIEWGIAVHQGKEFGLINKLVMLAGCIAIWLLGISAIVMWWKRRPKGRLAAPPRPIDKRTYKALAAVVVPLGLLYPLVGASMLIVLALDLAVSRARLFLTSKRVVHG